MSEVIVTESYLGDIAEAIRAKNGTQNTYKPSQMAAAIEALPTATIEPLSVTENGTYTAEQGKAYSPVTVDVPSGGSIGGLSEMVDVNSQDYQWAYMLMQMKKGQTTGGVVTFTTAFPNTESLFLDTGLSQLHGFLLVGYDQSLAENTGMVNSPKFSIWHINSDNTYNSLGVSSAMAGTGNTKAWMNCNQNQQYDGSPIDGKLRFDGGKIYYTARYNKNANYQMIGVNKPYEWLAW